MHWRTESIAAVIFSLFSRFFPDVRDTSCNSQNIMICGSPVQTLVYNIYKAVPAGGDAALQNFNISAELRAENISVVILLSVNNSKNSS